MALLYDATLTPGKLDLIAGWITGQRWYAGSSRGPLPVEQLRHVGRWRVDDPAGEVGCEVHLVADDSGVAAGGEPVIYQVPLTYRGAPLAGGEAALVGEMEHSVLGHRWVYDGCHDPVFAAELLGLTLGRVGAMSSTTSDAPEPDVVGHRHPDWGSELSVGSSRVLTGEQTNTSIVHTCTDASGAPVSVITKVFRVLAAGRNPDIELQGVLSAAGSTRVPRSVGHVTGRWRPENRDARPESSAAPLVDGDLTFTSVFLDGAVDAWRVTLALLRDGLPGIEERAAALAEATAEVHSVLAQRCLTRPVTDADVDAVIAGMQQRLAAAVAAAPELEGLRPAILEVFERARAAQWPRLQRIHGDLHLGQALDVPERGWVLIDFEGEPLRPLAQRSELDQPWRDVAGMLRSYDYAGAVADSPEASAAAARAEAAFLEAYLSAISADAATTDPAGPEITAPAITTLDTTALLDAYVLDKALYEVDYEARHRPTWLPLPVNAITRLIAHRRSTEI